MDQVSASSAAVRLPGLVIDTPEVTCLIPAASLCCSFFFVFQEILILSRIPRDTRVTCLHIHLIPSTLLDCLNLFSPPNTNPKDRPPWRRRTVTIGLPPSTPSTTPGPKLDPNKFQICKFSIL